MIFDIKCFKYKFKNKIQIFIYQVFKVMSLQKRLKGNAAYLKKITLGMKTIHPNTLRSHFVTIVPMAPFTPKSISKLRSALHINIR